MIRFSALLVALAIGLLVAGVAASSLPLVYVSIAVCAVAALLLAAGVLRHWSEIFGSGTKRPAASPFAASRPVPSPASAGRAAVGSAAAEQAAAWPAAAGQAATPGLAGFRTDAGGAPGSRWAAEPAAATGRAPAGADQAAPAAGARPGQDEADWASRGDRRPGRKGWSARRPAESAAEPEPEPAVAAAEPGHAAPTDDLWDRVNEELESAGKRDSGHLSWPAGDFSIPPGMSLPTEPPETLSGLGPAGSGDLWPPAAGWQPPTTPTRNWPFASPAESASARPTSRNADREPAEPEPVTQQQAEREPAGRPESAESAETARSVPVWDAPTRADAGQRTAQDDAAQDDAAQDEAADRDDAPDGAGTADQGAAPAWKIRPQVGPGTESTVVSAPPVLTPPARAAEPSPPAVPTESARSTEATEAPDSAEAAEPADATERAGTAESAEPAGPDRAAGPAKSGEPAEAAKSAGRTEPAKSAGRTEPAKSAGRAEAAKSASSAEAAAAPDSAVTQVGATQVSSPPEVLDANPEAKAEAAEADAAPDKPAEPASADGSAKTRGTGQVQVTVVPGVARYHRSECILIRFLSEGDLELMSKEEAVSTGLAACRACQPDQLPDT